jgi:GntR family transcriptional repressor for pyruvate dehydrogenase complex
MSAEALTRKSLSDQLADRLLSLIIDRQLAPGDSLPSTGELSEQFGVSRTVVREALADLAGRGIIERSQGRESIVAAAGSDPLTDMLRFHIRRDNIPPSAIMDFRQALETHAAELAAERATDADKAELRAALDTLAAAANEAAFHEADIAFHRCVAACSGNKLILLTHDALVDLLRDVRRKAYRGRLKEGTYSLDKVVADHESVLVAIEKGDAEQARAAMSHHLGMTGQHLSAS